MESNTTMKVVHPTALRVVHRLIIEEPHNDPAFEDTELNALPSDQFLDTYDYFPDFGI